MERLMEDNHIIVVAAAEVITILAKYCKDFLTRRVDDAWPHIMRVYTQAMERVEREGNSLGGDRKVQSANYKVWDALCKMLVSTLDNVQPSDEILDELCHVLKGVGLLARIDVRQAVERINMDIVWLQLAVGGGNSGEDEGGTLPIPAFLFIFHSLWKGSAPPPALVIWVVTIFPSVL
jgi:hypothetical protein